MGRGFICAIALVLAAGCIPGFDEFRRSRAGGDAGPGVDAGPGFDGGPGFDAGPGVDSGPARDAGGGGEGTLLGENADCAALMSSVLFEESFDSATPDFNVLSGSVRFEGGEAVIDGGQDFVLMQSLGSFRNVVACATVRLEREPGSRHELHFGLRGPMHGVSLNLVGEDDQVKLISVEPTTNVLVASQPIDWPDGVHKQRMLVFLEGDRIYGEVQDDASGDVAVVFGEYRGASDDVNANIEGSPLVSTAYVEHVILGIPTTAAGAVLRGE